MLGNLPLILGRIGMVCFCLIPLTVSGQNNDLVPGGGRDLLEWLGVLELPFLLVCLVYAWLSTRAMQDGILGRGLRYLLWGLILLTLLHICTQFLGIIGWQSAEWPFYAGFRSLLYIGVWGCFAFGFYHLYQVSK